LHHDRETNRFDLHPIVRRYAYDRLTAPDRAAAHTRLRDYFAGVPKPDKVTRVEDLAPVIELYHHTVRAGQFDEAWELFEQRIWRGLFYQLGGDQLQIDLLGALFPDGEDRPAHLTDARAQSHALNELANSYAVVGQPRCAVRLFEASNDIDEKLNDKPNLAIGLTNAATQQLLVGVLRAAETNLRRAIELFRQIKHDFGEAVAYQELGPLLAYRGAYAESETELATAMKMLEKQTNVQSQGIVWAFRALRELLGLRSALASSNAGPRISDSKSAIPLARRALELADEAGSDSRFVYPVRDYVRAHWLLGAACRVAGQHDEAEHHLHEALERCRRINMVDHEADILIDLARLRAATGAPDEARRLTEEALVITERSGYVLQGADANLELAKLALGRGDKAAALEHAQKARELATCDGPPDYTYKAAYDEAGAMLTELGQC
jgi:tetratricopeptide (TPR) repeat protein